MRNPLIHCTWCQDPSQEQAIASLFLDNADASYISHSELQESRADAPGRWSPRLAQALHDDIRSAIAQPPDSSHFLLATAHLDGQLAGIAFVSIDTRALASRQFAVIEDMMTNPAMRGQGVGTTMLEWITTALRARGVQRLFLESGILNQHAHTFFEHHGFQTVSVVMIKEL